MITDKELKDINFERFLIKALICINNNVIGSGNDIYLAVYSLIEINNKIIGSKNITLRIINVKPHACGKMYIDKDLIEVKLQQLIKHFNEKNIIIKNFMLRYSIIYMYFMIEIRELVKHKLLAILTRDYTFKKTNSIVHKGCTIRNGVISTFFTQKSTLKKSMKFRCFIVYLLLSSLKIA